MNSDQFSFLSFVGIVVFVYLLFIYPDMLRNRINELTLQNENLTLENQRLTALVTDQEIEINNLKMENERLSVQYNQIKKDTATLLAEYALKEGVWVISGIERYRFLCGLGQILLREAIPQIGSVPC